MVKANNNKPMVSIYSKLVVTASCLALFGGGAIYSLCNYFLQILPVADQHATFVSIVCISMLISFFCTNVLTSFLKNYSSFTISEFLLALMILANFGLMIFQGNLAWRIVLSIVILSSFLSLEISLYHLINVNITSKHRAFFLTSVDMGAMIATSVGIYLANAWGHNFITYSLFVIIFGVAVISLRKLKIKNCLPAPPTNKPLNFWQIINKKGFLDKARITQNVGYFKGQWIIYLMLLITTFNTLLGSAVMGSMFVFFEEKFGLALKNIASLEELLSISGVIVLLLIAHLADRWRVISMYKILLAATAGALILVTFQHRSGGKIDDLTMFIIGIVLAGQISLIKAIIGNCFPQKNLAYAFGAFFTIVLVFNFGSELFELFLLEDLNIETFCIALALGNLIAVGLIMKYASSQISINKNLSNS